MVHPSCHGLVKRCGDSKVRVLYPGIPFETLDGKEATNLCAVRAALANFPCPKCLVPQDLLHVLDQQFTPRTTESMRAVYQAALHAPNKTASETILRDHGLHATEVCLLLYRLPNCLPFSQNFFWSVANSDPYKAWAYDTLHVDDCGKWGKHLWPLVLSVLDELSLKGALSKKWEALFTKF